MNSSLDIYAEWDAHKYIPVALDSRHPWRLTLIGINIHSCFSYQYLKYVSV
jgi:hypothetical protein